MVQLQQDEIPRSSERRDGKKMGNQFGVGVPACGSPEFGAEDWRIRKQHFNSIMAGENIEILKDIPNIPTALKVMPRRRCRTVPSKETTTTSL
jgi:hypothetical protein